MQRISLLILAVTIAAFAGAHTISAQQKKLRENQLVESYKAKQAELSKQASQKVRSKRSVAKKPVKNLLKLVLLDLARSQRS